MKIYIDTETWTRIKEETEYPVLTGNNYVDKITVCYNSNPTNFYPTLNILKPNNRKVGPIMFDSNEQYPASFTDDDNNTWYYFDFTLSSNESQIDVAGKYNITITTHKTSSGVEVSQRNINTFLTVKNAVINDDGDILILSDEEDTSTVVASLRTLITQLQTLYTSLGSSKADRVGPLQDIFAKTLTAFVQLTTKYLEAAASGYYLKFYYDSGDDYYYFDVKVDDIELVSLNDIILKNTGHFKVVDTSNDHKLDFTDGELTIDEVKIPNKSYIDDNKVDYTDLSDALNSTATNKALSLKGAKDLKDLINGIKNGTSINNFSATESALATKIAKDHIADNYTTNDSTYVLSAKKGKELYDSLQTLYNYVGFATGDDQDTTINKLREVFQFLAGELDNSTLLTLLAGKQAVIDINNKLNADYVDDTNATNKFVSASEKAQITTNQTDITNIKDGTTIDSFADVESELSGKQDTLSGSTSIDITSNVVSVNDSYIENFFATSEEIDTMLEEVFG